MSPKSRVEDRADDAAATSTSNAPLVMTTSGAGEPLEISQQIMTNDLTSEDEGVVLSLRDSGTSNGVPTTGVALLTANSSLGGDKDNDDEDCRDVNEDDSHANTMLENNSKMSANCTVSAAGVSETVPNSLLSSGLTTEREPPLSPATSPAADQWRAGTTVSEFPPLTIHPFDMPCPLQVGNRRRNSSLSAAKVAAHVIEDDSDRSKRSELTDEKVAKQQQDDDTQQKLAIMYPNLTFDDDNNLLPNSDVNATKSSAELELKKASQHDLENQLNMDDSKAEKCWCPSSTRSTSLLIDQDDEDDTDFDDALRPPELMRQDAASGLVWSVSQPGAFREGGNGEEAEDDHDDWMMATRIVETGATVDDSQIIVHAAAVVDDETGLHEQDQQLQQQVSSFVVMGGEVEAIGICQDSVSPRMTPLPPNPPKHPRRLYFAFVCAIVIAVTVTIFVTVEVVSSSSNDSSQSSVDWPTFAPLGTLAPTSSELLIRSSSNNLTFTSRPNGVLSNPDDFVWKSLGQSLDGQFPNETMGYSISISAVGWILAVGSPWANDVSQAGSVSVFQLGDQVNWTVVGNIMPGIANGERFGWSVDISDSGDILAASAPSVGAGRVSIYQFDAHNLLWDKMGEDLVGEYDGQNFGYAISLSGIGSILAVGSPGSANDTGHVMMYRYSGSAWKPMGSIISGFFEGQRFGGSVSLSLDGETLAVGTIEHRCSRHIPHVRVYHWNSSDWEIMGNTINGTSAFDQCAMSVAISADGTTVAAGAYLSSNDNTQVKMTGNVLVFRWVLDRWVQLGKTIPGKFQYGNFGVSVAMSLDGNILVAGANLSGENGAGRVRVFHFNQTIEDWQQHGSTITGDTFDEFGKSVAMTPGGRVVAGGAYMHSKPGLDQSGEVRVYTSF